jgi:antitoxin component of MazEF toxin-antitoxin module
MYTVYIGNLRSNPRLPHAVQFLEVLKMPEFTHVWRHGHSLVVTIPRRLARVMLIQPGLVTKLELGSDNKITLTFGPETAQSGALYNDARHTNCHPESAA